MVACGGSLAAAALTPAQAHADAGDLVTWAAANGFRGTVQVIVTRGSLVCADVALGDTGEQAALDLWLNTGIEALADARAFVVAAVENLCPQYDHRGQAAATSRAVRAVL